MADSIPWIAPYGQASAWLEGQVYLAYPRCLREGIAWGQGVASQEWPVGSYIRLCDNNAYWTAPPPLGRKIRADVIFVNTEHDHEIQEVIFTHDFRRSRWITIRFQVMGHAIWTNVVREPNDWRFHRSFSHYTNWHTQWGTLLAPNVVARTQ